MKRLFRAVFATLLFMPSACGSESPDIVERARSEAKAVAPDAELVQIEFTHFGFAVGKNGIPDMSKAGPPKLAMFNFYSRAAGTGFRVVADINRDPLPPEMAKMMQERGHRDVRVERGQVPFSPFTLPIPERIGDINRAIEAAQQTIAADCAGANPAMSSCSLVQSAELHMHWSGPKDGGGTPVWTVQFGQHPKTLAPVRRSIEASSNRLFAGRDAQPASYNDHETKPLRPVDVTVAREFDALWPTVVAAVQKQDPLYAPYAVSLITYLRDRRESGGRAMISEAHIQFARQTPSLIWDDLEAHVGWYSGGESRAHVFFSQPRRRVAPLEPVPLTLPADKLPRADGALTALLKHFPEGYAEISTTWAKGCEDILTASPGLTMWRCGVYVATQQRSDLVFLWLSHQSNPSWQSGRGPLDTEYRMVKTGAPKDGWSWWTRVKHPAYWEYFLIDAMSGRSSPGFCTNPNTGANTIQTRPCRG